MKVNDVRPSENIGLSEAKKSLGEDSRFLSRSTFDRSGEISCHRPSIGKQKLIPTGRFDMFSPDRRLAASTLLSNHHQDGPQYDSFKTPTQDRTNSLAEYSTSEVKEKFISESEVVEDFWDLQDHWWPISRRTYAS